MKAYNIIILGLALSSLTSRICAFDSSSPDENRQARIEAEKAKRRENREKSPTKAGVFEPSPEQNPSVEIVGGDKPLEELAQMYSNLSGMEVIVSGRVLRKPITLAAQALPKADAVLVLETGFEKTGVRIVHIDGRTSVLAELESTVK